MTFLLVSATGWGQNVLSGYYLDLTRSGSLPLPTSHNQLYLARYAGIDTLTANLYITYPTTPLTGTEFTIWFNSDLATIYPTTDWKVFILGQDYTSLVSGNVNQKLKFTYDGSNWTVDNVTLALDHALLYYVTLAQMNDTLDNYPTYLDLSDSLSLFARKGKASFDTITVPTKTDSDSSTSAASTAFVKKAINPLRTYAPLAGATFTGAVYVPTISGCTTSSTQAVSAAFLQAVATCIRDSFNNAMANFSNFSQLDTLAAGTIDLSSYVTGVYNKVETYRVTGNLVLTANVFPGNTSEIELHLYFTGTDTVSAGAHMSFAAITGANTHTSVLTLTWDVYQQVYIKKSFEQN